MIKKNLIVTNATLHANIVKLKNLAQDVINNNLDI